MAQQAQQEQEAKTRFCRKYFDPDTGEFTFAFGDGDNLTVNVDRDFSDDMKRHLMFHGLAQKGGDSYASAKGNFEQGKASLRQVLDQLRNGEWRAARGEGEARPRIGELAAAISQLKGLPLDKATEVAEAASDDQRKQWRAHPKVQAIIQRIRLEKAEAAAANAPEFSVGG